MEPSNSPKVTLIGWTSSFIPSGSATQPNRLGPLQVIAIVWKQSKEVKSLYEIIQEVYAMKEEELADLMTRVLEGVPVVEAVTFNFVLENVSISWREQMVRHRVGTHPDPRVGVDWDIAVQEIPELADMSAWSQSMRLLDMSNFAKERRYRTPESVVKLGEDAVKDWDTHMRTIEIMYESWALRGVPLEDARDLIPLGATSRIAWTLNLRTLQHIVGKRGCTILQLGLWGPIIQGMIAELVAKIHPIFGTLVTPPCLKGDKYVGCLFPEDIRRRGEGQDGYLPVCPLFLGCDRTPLGHDLRERRAAGTLPNLEGTIMEAERRERFWARDPWTGARKGRS